MNQHSKSRLIYFPGIDGTGRLLHRQRRLFDAYDVCCISYPQDQPRTYQELSGLGEEQLSSDGGIILAESFGGAVALDLALRRPDLVKRLVLVNTFAWFPRRPLIQLLKWGGRLLPQRTAPQRFRGPRGILFFPPATPKLEQNAWWELTADVPMRAYGMRVSMIADLDLRARLPEIKTPATVFVSPNDRIVPPTAGRLLAKRLPYARLIELPAGHAAMIDPRVDVAGWLDESEFAPDRSGK